PQRTVGRPSTGTSLAAEACVPPPSGFRAPTADAVWRIQRDRIFLTEARKTARKATASGIAVQLTIFGILWDAGYPIWRIGALAGLYAAFMLAHRLILGRTSE